MFRLFLILVLAVTLAVAADDVFKKCKQVPFCQKLRNPRLDDETVFSADINSTSLKNNILTVPLKNRKDIKLYLKISLLTDRKARVKVEELKSRRFDLKNIVIEKEPLALDVKTELVEDGINLVPKNKTIPYKAIIVNKENSFTVEFHYNNKLDLTLVGNRLYMENTGSENYAFITQFQGAKKLYGLSYHADTLALRDTKKNRFDDPFRLRNSDAFGYEAHTTKALYGTVPFIYAHSPNNTYGIFLHNAAEQWIDISYRYEEPSAYFMVERAALDLFVLFGPTTKDVVRQLVDLTGKAHLPQLWTLGYHQCRFSYKSADDVKEVVARMDQNEFPMDAIWLDGDHANHSKWFQFNETTFKQPLELLKNISASKRKCVSISDPHFKVDDTYSVYAGAKNKYFIKSSDGQDYKANCWPGLSSWIDYLNPKASDYYASWFAFDKFNGTDPTLAGIWNDMNEPAVFDENIEKTLPFDALHHGNVSHGDIHNIYGLLQTKATYKGLMDRDKGKKRPFILTRSHFAGSQRYAAMWTGDNSANWEHLAVIYPECMTSNLGGMVFCGADIGGFIGDPSDELLQRWYQAAVWTPFFRGHSNRGTKRREPYLFKKEVQDVIRNAIKLRYRHIPVFYNLFYQYTKTGDPIIRPLFYEYPDIFESDHQLLLGTDIMAVAVTKSEVKDIEVIIPGNPDNDCWYRIDDHFELYKPGVQTVAVNITTSPVFYRCGSIIMTKDIVKRSTADTLNDPYTVYVNLNENNEAIGTFYMDDFVSFDYQQEKYFHIAMSYKHNGLKIRQIDGNSTGFNHFISNVIIHKPSNSSIRNNNIYKSLEMRHTKTRDETPLVNLDISGELHRLDGDTLFIPF